MTPPAVDRSSELKRHRSPIDRDPSPKRYRTDDEPEPEIPPGFSKIERVRLNPELEEQDKSPLAPKHKNCGGVGPYRRCFARETDSERGCGSDPKENLKDTSKSPLRVQNVPACDLQKTVNATTADYASVRRRVWWRKRRYSSGPSPLWGLGPGYDSNNRRIKKEDDSSEDDTSGDDSSGDDSSDVSDGDGDRVRKMAEELLLNCFRGKN